MFKGVLCGSLKSYFATFYGDKHGKERFYEVAKKNCANDDTVFCDNTCVPRFRFVNEHQCSGYEMKEELSYRYCAYASIPFSSGGRLRKCNHPNAIVLAKDEDLLFALEDL